MVICKYSAGFHHIDTRWDTGFTQACEEKGLCNPPSRRLRFGKAFGLELLLMLLFFSSCPQNGKKRQTSYVIKKRTDEESRQGAECAKVDNQRYCKVQRSGRVNKMAPFCDPHEASLRQPCDKINVLKRLHTKPPGRSRHLTL